MRQKRRIMSIGLAAIMLVSLCAVCATTSVAAYQDSSGAPANGLDSGTAVCSWGAGRLDVFAKGTDNNLKHKWWDGAWHSWEDLGAPEFNSISSAPTAVSWGYGRIDVFVRATDGLLFHKWFYQGWHDWEFLGMLYSGPHDAVSIETHTAPAACSWGTNRLDIFVVGTDGQLWQKWWGNGWHDWVPLGKPSAGLGGSPGAVSTVSWGYPRVDIFIRGKDGALWQLWWKSGWQAWCRFGDTVGLLARAPHDTGPSDKPWNYYGYYFYAPGVCSWGNDRLDVFFVDTHGHLQQKWWSNGWRPLYQVGGVKYLTASPSAVAWQNAGTTRIDIFTRGDDFALWQLFYAEGWRGWYNLGLI